MFVYVQVLHCMSGGKGRKTDWGGGGGGGKRIPVFTLGKIILTCLGYTIYLFHCKHKKVLTLFWLFLQADITEKSCLVQMLLVLLLMHNLSSTIVMCLRLV